MEYNTVASSRINSKSPMNTVVGISELPFVYVQCFLGHLAHYQ